MRNILVKPLYFIAVCCLAFGCAFTAAAMVIEANKAPKP